LVGAETETPANAKLPQERTSSRANDRMDIDSEG
jgi:hypothetical protein